MTNLFALPSDGYEYEFTPTGLVISPGMPFEMWQALGASLGRIHNAIQWAIADWIRYGEAEYGEMYAQSIEDTGRSYRTLANYVWVAGKFEFSRRRENLSFSHHAEVAALPEQQQECLLDAAEAAIKTEGHPQSAAWLREKVQEALGRETPVRVCPYCGHVLP